MDFDSYHAQKQISNMRLKWTQSAHYEEDLKPYKLMENPVRDLILDWLNGHLHCWAYMVEMAGSYHGKKKIHMKNKNRHYEKLMDIHGFWKGRPLTIEVKRPKTQYNAPGVPSPDQIRHITRSIRYGGIAFFAWGLKDVHEQITEFEKGLGLR